MYYCFHYFRNEIRKMVILLLGDVIKAILTDENNYFCATKPETVYNIC